MIKKILNKLINKSTTTTEVIVDKTIYSPIDTSYAGGALAYSNMLVVSNKREDHAVWLKRAETENFDLSFCYCKDSKLTNDDIVQSSDDLIGPFNHIINIIHKDPNNGLLLNNLYNDEDSLRMLYVWIQKESDYLVDNVKQSTICSIYIGDNSVDAETIKGGVEALIKGLALPLSKHGIVETGIIADLSVPYEKINETALYLSSKYGQIITGEVMKMVC